MRIALLEPLGISRADIDELAGALKRDGHDFVYFDSVSTDTSELVERSNDAEIVMIANHPYPDAVIEQIDTLKMIAVAFTGIDHVGLAACRKRGITVCNCAGYSNVSVAELTIGLTISVLRKIVNGDAAVRACGDAAGLTGREISGRTVGIVGTGRIGTQVARLYRAFGARVLGFAPHRSQEAIDAGIEFTSEEELLESSDIVTLHLPLNDSTRKSFGTEQLGRMKRSAILINCARGAIVDNQALADALNDGRIAGAGIDVFDMEPPLPNDYPLLSADNIVLTPHVAFLTEEAMERRARIEFDNVTAYLAGKPQNVMKL
ncbi:D-isomer specific 2-hydroxyacid dehydrogenase NAD-binding protein [Coriobacterium glomerans PW2]|uniref:D-isomer specific 2-hydroxyacid dehydrogenase NAD-binding protein n=1 Tax=Coriobacterium glomerans (strain ATCC 49209 / DSM 20642 / JCM 10262 / PW2) TaxID=700015 RepID=F2N966_CORGP|nr:2-hydroxyacid dehydrogenase [Coriobacterium glomerans]AEB07742.1 D-isomer specific 2-hydroxyacid dehydrogenase NAD-binding protein [Coriobacterium glomerans PW2]